MGPHAKHRPGGGGAPSASVRISAQSSSRFIGTAQLLRLDPRFRRLTERLHRLGPRPTGELLLERIEHHGIEQDVLARLEAFAALDEAVLDWADGRRWPPVPCWRVA